MNDAYVTRDEFRTEMRELRTEMRAEFSELRTEMRAEFRDVRGEISRLKFWMLSALLALVVALIANPQL